MVERPGVGVDEERGAGAGRFEAVERRADGVPHRGGGQVEAALGGDLFALLGDERGLHRRERHRDVDHGVGGREFEVDAGTNRLGQEAHVAVVDVAPILAQVDGDAVGAAQLGQHGRADRVGLVGAARLPHRGHVIDVDVEPHIAIPSLVISSNVADAGAAAVPGRHTPTRTR